MSKWTRVYKSDDMPIYVYRTEDGTYRTYAYRMVRYYKGEDALKNTIQFVKDFGDSTVVIKELND